MNSTLQKTGASANHRGTLGPGIILTGAALISVALVFLDVRLAFAPLATVAFIFLARALGFGAMFPREKIGWLYAAVIFITCWAPSLGGAGTAARFGMAGLVAVTALFVALSRKGNQPLPTWLKIGLSVLIIGLIIGLVGAASTGYGVARMLNWIMFIPLAWLVYQRPNVRGILLGIVATCVFQMIGVGLQMAGLMAGTWGGLLTSGTTYDPTTSAWLRRYTGFIWNPNNLALVLVCGVVAMAACLLINLPARIKIACVAMIGLFTFGIVVSGSRGGLVAVALALLVLSVAAGKRGVAFGILAVAAAAVIIQFAASKELDRLIESLGEIISGTDASAAQRSGVWATRLQSQGGLLIGSGFGGYDPGLFANQRGLDIDPAAARQATVDNSWLKMLLESGLIGAAGMAITMLHPMLGSLFKSPSQNRIWGITAGATLAALMWRSLSVDMLDQNPWNAIVFIAAGMAAASFKRQPDELPKPQTPASATDTSLLA